MGIKRKELVDLNNYLMAANYLSLAQLYLWDNVILKRKLSFTDIKPKLVGHWGTAPGQNFIYTHLNRIIKNNNLNMIYVSGPGHGGQAMIAHAYLEGTYTDLYPKYTKDYEGIKKLCRDFSFPGGVSSHVAPSVPGSINEGGELGYSLSHAYGAVLDNPSLIAACIIGDGEAETGPLSASWDINKLINPKTDGIVLPIINLNGYKISNPTILGRMTDRELINLFKGHGYKPYIVKGSDITYMHQDMATVLDQVVLDIKKLKKGKKIPFPMVIVKTPKGWGAPKRVCDKPLEGSFRSHQVPFPIDSEENLKLLNKWFNRYRPDKIFDDDGKIRKEILNILPSPGRRMTASKYANGGLLLKDLVCPEFKKYGIVVKPGITKSEDMKEMGKYLRDLVKLNKDSNNFRIFGPDEALSNRLNYVFDTTTRKWNGSVAKNDELLGNGKVIDSILSEHVCEGMLEGYILTGRHGVYDCYESFVRIIDSMVSQHAKWLKLCNEVSWREDISSLNFILTSHIWQQDHNGFTHQDPGFLDHIAIKKPDVSRIYLPIDTNTLLSTIDHVVKTKNYINVVVASKLERPQWLNMDEAVKHCKKGLGELTFISDKTTNPDLILACAGDTPTIETVAAKKIISKFLPNLKVRVINVIDLMRLIPDYTHPHGISDKDYDELFTKDKPIIHMLTYKRSNRNLHVHGYMEEGTITTPFDMRVINKIDRYHLVLNAIKYLDLDKINKKDIEDYCNKMLEKHNDYIRKNGVDMEEVDDFMSL